MGKSPLVTLDNLNTVYKDVRDRIDAAVGGIYHLKGSTTVGGLPSSTTIGYVYNISEDGKLNGKDISAGTNVAYTSDGWVTLGGVFEIATDEHIGVVRTDSTIDTTPTTSSIVTRHLIVDSNTGVASIQIPMASETTYGLISINEQTFKGNKIFSDNVEINNAAVVVKGTLTATNLYGENVSATTLSDNTGNLIIESDTAEINNLYSTNSTITDIEATKISPISEDNGLYIQSSNSTISNLEVTNATITNVVSTTLNVVTDVNGNGGTIKTNNTTINNNLTSDYVISTTIDCSSLKSTTINVIESTSTTGSGLVTTNVVKAGDFTNYGTTIVSSTIGNIIVNGKGIKISNYNDEKIIIDTATHTVEKLEGDASIQTSGNIWANFIGANGVMNAVWNDLVDCIEVPEDTDLEYGYCYSFDGENYNKTKKYLEKSFIGINSDTYGMLMGIKNGKKSMNVAVAGFVLAYVDKEYTCGTPLTCTKDGYLTKINIIDEMFHPERVVATYWKSEHEETWGSEERQVQVNGRKWVKIK